MYPAAGAVAAAGLAYGLAARSHAAQDDDEMTPPRGSAPPRWR